MLIPEGQWTEEDSVAARDIFKTKVWSKMLAIMLMNKPKIDAATKDERYDQSLKRQTWEECLDMFAAFTAIETVKEERGLQQVDMSEFSSSKKFEQVI